MRRGGNGSNDKADRILMENDSLSVTILPAAGGNIAEMTDKRSGRNWLWQNPHIPIDSARTGDDYGLQLDSGGWDEILLSVTADQIDLTDELKHRVADHGELVRRRWNADVRTNERDETLCEMSVVGEFVNYEFRRVVTLHRDAPRMDVDYQLTNREEFALPWYWCAHALVDAQPNMRINLPTGLPYRIEGKVEQLADRQLWPTIMSAQQERIDLSRSFASDGSARRFARKIFTQAPESGIVSVEAPDTNECLTMRFDPEVLPWLGLWINNRGWSGCGSEPYLNLGLEPSTTPYDSVSEAIENDAVIWLNSGASREWSVSVELAS
jgi:hypothetical protein